MHVVRVGLTRDASAAPLFVGMEGAVFQAEGVALQLSFLKTDALVADALAAGQVDVGLVALSPAYYAAAAAHGFKVIASRSAEQTGFPMSALLVSKRAQAAGLTGVRGLPNQRIALTGPDVGAEYGLFKIASRFKLDGKSFKILRFRSKAARLEALARGDVDAVLLAFAAALASQKRGDLLLRLSDFAQWQQGVVIATEKTIASRRPLVEQFVRAYQRGTAAYQLNFLNYDDGGDFIPGPDHARYLDAIARQVRVSAALLSKTTTYCDRRANVDASDIQAQVRFWQGQGRLDTRLDAAQFLDLSFIGEEGSEKQ